jgi:hypothetical protein
MLPCPTGTTLKWAGKLRSLVSNWLAFARRIINGLLFICTVGWELSVWALTDALYYLDTPEAQQFLDDHFVELMRILGMQKLVWRQQFDLS